MQNAGINNGYGSRGGGIKPYLPPINKKNSIPSERKTNITTTF